MFMFRNYISEISKIQFRNLHRELMTIQLKTFFNILEMNFIYIKTWNEHFVTFLFSSEIARKANFALKCTSVTFLLRPALKHVPTTQEICECHLCTSNHTPTAPSTQIQPHATQSMRTLFCFALHVLVREGCPAPQPEKVRGSRAKQRGAIGATCTAFT